MVTVLCFSGDSKRATGMENTTLHFQLEEQQGKQMFFLPWIRVIYSQGMGFKTAVQSTLAKMGQSVVLTSDVKVNPSLNPTSKIQQKWS